MLQRLLRRSLVLAAVATLAFAGTVLADSVAADGDEASGVQNFVDLGTVGPGATISRDVGLVLFCGGTRHVDPGQLVTLSQASVTVPLAGGSMSGTSSTLGPVPPEWANDTVAPIGCSGPMALEASVPSHVTIVAPSTPGVDYLFSISYGRTLSPVGVSDGASVAGLTIVTFSLDVAEDDTTPPALDGLPGDLHLVTHDPAGATLDYDQPTATDDRDPAPAVACAPAPGDLVPVGATTVTCTATDASGNETSGSVEVTVSLGSVTWDEPIQGDGLSVNLGRNVPVKARAWLDGEAVLGAGRFEVRGCASGAAAPERVVEAAQSDAGRWMAGLDTSGLAVGCHTVALVVDGTTLGSFALDVVDPPTGGAARGRAGHRPS